MTVLEFNGACVSKARGGRVPSFHTWSRLWLVLLGYPHFSFQDLVTIHQVWEARELRPRESHLAQLPLGEGEGRRGVHFPLASAENLKHQDGKSTRALRSVYPQAEGKEGLAWAFHPVSPQSFRRDIVRKRKTALSG